MHRSKEYLPFVLTIVSILLLLLPTSCKRQEEVKPNPTLAILDDSIGTKAPSAYKMTVDAMKGAKDSMEYYEYAVRLAKYFMLSATPDSAIPWIDRTERFIGTPDTPHKRSILAYAYNTKAGYLHNFHKGTDETIELYNKAYGLLMQSDAKDQTPNVCANLADAYVYENNLPQAASWYRRALFLTDSLRLPEKENITLYLGLALIYQQLGDDNRAIGLFEKTDRHFTDMTVPMQAYFLNNYGSFYYYKKDYKKSKQIFERLMHFLELNHMDNNFDMYLCKLNLSDVCLNLKEFNLSEKYLNEVEPFWKKEGDPAALYYCSTIRLGIATGRGDVQAASTIVKGQEDDSDIMASMRRIRNRYLRLYYEETGNWQAAYRNLQIDIEENDSLEHNRSNMHAADIMTQYVQDTLKLHNDLRMESKEAEVEHTRLWLVVSIGILFIMILTVIILVLYIHRRKLRAQMQTMHLRLESARNRISPHFVFNVLNNRIVDADKKESDELLNLTKLIRTNLDIASKLTVTLADELDFIDKYVRVERKLLADDDFTYTVDITEGLDPKSITIPSMIIQILVENAFVHALMGRTGHKLLTVKIRHENGSTKISVIDNGPGFTVRSSLGKGRIGLNVIRQTIAIINAQNRQHIRFNVSNITDEQGNRKGCDAQVIVPDGLKYPN